MTVSYNTFERLKEKGLAAYKAGDYPSAKPYLMQAADAMIKIASETQDVARRRRRKAMAAELIEFANQCDSRAAVKKGGRRTAAREEDDGGAKASDWIVREKPDICFEAMECPGWPSSPG